MEQDSFFAEKRIEKTMAKKRIGIVFMIPGILLITAGLGLIGYNKWDDHRAEQSAHFVLDRFTSSPDNTHTTQPDRDNVQTSTENEPDPDRPMPVTEIDGYGYIGVLEIPVLNLELPVIESWDYERMRIAPCRYSGSAYKNDMIIAAHNYNSHFGTLRDLQPEDTVLFTDAEGQVFTYMVSQTTLLDGTAVEEMESGTWDLTLFTCTIGGQARVTVRCTQTENE